MFPSVQSSFTGFSTRFEGRVPYMYLDVLGLVTIGVGNLIDPIEAAAELPFRFKTTGSLATPDQITQEWQSIKSNASLKTRGYTACAALTQLELADEAIESWILGRLTQNESFLKRQQWFLNFDTWPADAQLGLLSMAWAMGPGGPGGFPQFRAACQRLDFATAAAQCRMNEAGNPGLIPRNQANFTLFSNGAIVAAGGLQPSTLYYPQVLTTPVPSAASPTS